MYLEDMIAQLKKTNKQKKPHSTAKVLHPSFCFQYGDLYNITLGNHEYDKNGDLYSPLLLCQDFYRNGSVYAGNETFVIDAEVNTGMSEENYFFYSAINLLLYLYGPTPATGRSCWV